MAALRKPVEHLRLVGGTLRAVTAYWAAGEREGIDPPAPSLSRSHLEAHGGHEYVVLRNNEAVLAVYRVTNRGQLKRLRRWPKEIEA